MPLKVCKEFRAKLKTRRCRAKLSKIAAGLLCAMCVIRKVLAVISERQGFGAFQKLLSKKLRHLRRSRAR